MLIREEKKTKYDKIIINNPPLCVGIGFSEIKEKPPDWIETSN